MQRDARALNHQIGNEKTNEMQQELVKVMHDDKQVEMEEYKEIEMEENVLRVDDEIVSDQSVKSKDDNP